MMAALPLIFSFEPRFKEQFASLLNEGFSPFTAGLRVFPGDAGAAHLIATNWPDDPYVTAYRDRLVEKAAAASKPPVKEAQIKRIEARLSKMEDDDYLKGERLIAEMCGHIEKAASPSVTVNNQQNVVERVLVMRDHGSFEQWENKMAEQQAKLVSEATT